MRRSPLLALWLTVLIDLLGFGLILPLLPLYASDHHASKPVVGLLFASFSVMQLLFAPFWGRLSDRIGRRPVLLVGLAGSAASYVLFALAELMPHPLLWLFVSRTLAGGFAGGIATAYAYVADVTDGPERGRSMALIGAAFGVGFTIGPAVGGLGHAYLGRLAPGLLAAGFSFSALVFAWFRLPEPERHRPAEERGLRFGALRRALATEGVAPLLALAFVTTVAFAMLESTLALLASDRFHGWDPKQNGWLFSYLGFWLALAQGLIVRRLMHRVGERRFTVIGSALLAAGLLAVGHAPTPFLVAAATPLPVLGFAMIMPSVSSLISRRASSGRRGEILGVSQSVQSLGRIVGPALGPALLVAGLALPYRVAAGIMLLGAVLAIRWIRTPPVSA